MANSNSLKRRNNVNKYLDSKDLLKRGKSAQKRGIPELYRLSVAINQRLIDLKKNQEWLVDETEIGKATISAYYNAESLPNGANLLKLAKVLQTTPDYLLGFTDTPTTDIEIKAICDYTGLSEEAITLLTEEKHGKLFSNFLNGFIVDDNFLAISSTVGYLKMQYPFKIHYEKRKPLSEKIQEYYQGTYNQQRKQSYTLNRSEAYDFKSQQTIDRFKDFLINFTQREITQEILDGIDLLDKYEQEKEEKELQEIKAKIQKEALNGNID